MLDNYFIPGREMNFTGFTGTKSAKIKKGMNISEMEKTFRDAENIETGKDAKGEFITVTLRGYKKY